MPHLLILKLQGPMQAWGGHTFEDYRPSELFPTRSGLVGLLAACLGLRRYQREQQRGLSESFRYAVRADRFREDGTRRRPVKITDYHTVLGARRVDGSAGKFPVQTRREYLCDAAFTVALEFLPQPAYGLEAVRDALQRPRFTPYLGRRSCPLARRLLHGIAEAADLHAALAATEPKGGTIYTEVPGDDLPHLRVRDVPAFRAHRQFLTRDVFLLQQEMHDDQTDMR